MGSRRARVRARVVRRRWREASVTYASSPRLGRRRFRARRPAFRGPRIRFGERHIHAGRNSFALVTGSRRIARFSAREGKRPAKLRVFYSAPVVAPPPAPGSPPAPPPPAPPPAKVILAAGDIQPAGSTSSPTAPLLDANRYDALLTLGDNQYDDGSLAEYTAYYAKTWGVPAHLSRTYPAPGNHEARSGLAENYCVYFGAGAAVDPCPGGHAYYSFDLGSWHVVSLDSSTATIDNTQRVWLRADLAAHPARCTLAFWHHPRYAPSFPNTLNDVWADLMAAGVDVALVGHDHNYQRYAPMDNAGRIDPVNGIRQFLVGTGGDSHLETKSMLGQEVVNTDTWGVLRMVLGTGTYQWSFLPEAGRTFTDSGQSGCH
jgi:acid phosphatase type 7